MTRRVDEVIEGWRQTKRPLLMVALVAGDPHLHGTLEFLRRVSDEGADLIELIFPFSEPTYHGPVLRRACDRALHESVDWDEIVELGAAFRQTHRTPVFLSTYYNRILQRGERAAAEDLERSGFDGVMVTDLPFGEDEALRDELRGRTLGLIEAVAPTTAPARMAEIVSQADDFLLWTGHSGGEPTLSAEAFRSGVRCLKELTSLPVIASMKVAAGDDAARVSRVADGVLVGSALVWLVEGRGADILDNIGALVRELRRGLDREAEGDDRDEQPR